MKSVTLEKIQKDLKDFDYDTQMFIYHKMNGRDEEAQSYLDAILEVKKAIVNELKPANIDLDDKIIYRTIPRKEINLDFLYDV